MLDGSAANDRRLLTRAVQIWQILVGCAVRRETKTYEGLVEAMGHHQPKTLAKQLARILYYCKQHALPPLTVLVVNKNTGQPGEGLPDEVFTSRRGEGRARRPPPTDPRPIASGTVARPERRGER